MKLTRVLCKQNQKAKKLGCGYTYNMTKKADLCCIVLFCKADLSFTHSVLFMYMMPILCVCTVFRVAVHLCMA